MEKETLQYLANFTNEISPELWEAMLNYIYAAAFQWTVAGILLLVIGCLLLFLDYKYEFDELNGVGFFIGGIVIIISVCCFGSAVGRFLAPEWYAIKYLLAYSIL